MSNINLLTVKAVTAISGMHERIADVKAAIEQRINLEEYSDNIRPVTLNHSVVLRICLLAGLSDKSPRTIDDLNDYNLVKSNTPYATTFFTKSDIGTMFEILLKMRYHDVEADWTSPNLVSKVIGREILRGRDILLKEGGIDEWLTYVPLRAGRLLTDIPELNLRKPENILSIDNQLLTR